MPMYYDFGQNGKVSTITTSGTANTETARAMLLTQSAKPSANITGVFANAQGSTAGGGFLACATFATAGAVGTGTAQTPGKKNPNEPASQVLCTTGTFTAGSGTRTDRITVGFAQTGGQGGWIAVTPDAALVLFSGGGATGYGEFRDLANAASQQFSYEIEWFEA